MCRFPNPSLFPEAIPEARHNSSNAERCQCDFQWWEKIRQRKENASDRHGNGTNFRLKSSLVAAAALKIPVKCSRSVLCDSSGETVRYLLWCISKGSCTHSNRAARAINTGAPLAHAVLQCIARRRRHRVFRLCKLGCRWLSSWAWRYGVLKRS